MKIMIDATPISLEYSTDSTPDNPTIPGHSVTIRRGVRFRIPKGEPPYDQIEFIDDGSPEFALTWIEAEAEFEDTQGKDDHSDIDIICHDCRQRVTGKPMITPGDKQLCPQCYNKLLLVKREKRPVGATDSATD